MVTQFYKERVPFQSNRGETKVFASVTLLTGEHKEIHLPSELTTGHINTISQCFRSFKRHVNRLKMEGKIQSYSVHFFDTFQGAWHS